MAPSRAEARILRDLRTKVPAPEARRILRCGLRVAALLNDGHPDERVLEYICDALAQEGGLVQELVEDLVSRLLRRPAAAGLPQEPAPGGR